jgi:hypothetical protein
MGLGVNRFHFFLKFMEMVALIDSATTFTVRGLLVL